MIDKEIRTKFDAHRSKLREVYGEIPVKGIYMNSRSQMDFSFEGPDGKPKQVVLDPMLSSIVVSSVVPKSAVLIRGGHGGGKTSMIEEVSSRLFDIPKEEIVAAMIRGNDDQNVNTLLASFHIGKLLANGDEEVRWRKFVTCPVKIADEINRFPPTAQNALFEIFNKGRVEFANQVYEVEDFELFATENPKDVGTYPMSKPFLDRFGICIPAPQLPSAEDLMALSGRRDDKLYAFENGNHRLSIKDTKSMERAIADNVRISSEGLLYMIYLGQALATCARGDFGDKSHSEVSLLERCKNCEFDTKKSLCQLTENGFSGRAFLEMQRWSRGYSFFIDAFKDPDKPEVQQSVIQAIAPYVMYHRVDPQNTLFTQDPHFGRRLEYLKYVAETAKTAFLTVREPLNEMPGILSGQIDPTKAKIYQVKKDLVVRDHFLPLVEAAKSKEFRAFYNAVDKNDVTPADVLKIENQLVFGSDLSPRARAFLRSKAQIKAAGGQSL